MSEIFNGEREAIVQKVLKQKKDGALCFAMISDTRLSDWERVSVENISAVDKAVGFECVVHLGNFIRGNNPKNISMELLEEEFELYKNCVRTKKLFPLRGKTDGYRDERFLGQLAENIMTDELWYQKTQFLELYENVKRERNKSYYYVDFEDKNVRLIFLSSYFTQVDEENGLFEQYERIDTRQGAWLKNEALNLKSGQTAVIFSHSLPKSRFATGRDPFIYNGASTEPIIMILQQAKRKGINIAAWFCGHYNCDSNINVGGINYAVMPKLEPSEVTESRYADVTVYKNRENNSTSMDLWDVVVLDTCERKIYLNRFGCGEDRVMEY